VTGGAPIVPVMLDGIDAGADERHRAALATLPARYVMAEDAAGGVAVVSGSGEDWVKRAIRHLDAGASAVLLVIGAHLDVAGLDAVGQAARSAGAVAAADLEYAAEPAWTSLAASVSLGEIGLMDGLAVTAGPLGAAAIRLLVTLAAAVRPLPPFEVIAEAPGHLALGSAAASAPVTLTAVRGPDEDGQRLDLVARQVRYEISWPGRPRAGPVLACTHTAAGTARAPLSYQAAERGLWERLHARIVAGHEAATDGLDQLRTALEAFGR
jgi:hypothetical protein